MPYAEEQVGSSIASQCNFIKDVLNNYCIQQSGIAVVAENINEDLLTGYNNCVGPKCLITFVSEEAYGDSDIQEVTGYVQRYFDVLVQRGKVLGDPRNIALTNTTGPVRPLYNQVEEVRDIIRRMIFPVPFVVNPVWYHATRPNDSRDERGLLDSYIINFSIICSLPRIQYDAPQVSGGNGPFIGLVDNTSLTQFNKNIP